MLSLQSTRRGDAVRERESCDFARMTELAIARRWLDPFSARQEGLPQVLLGTAAKDSSGRPAPSCFTDRMLAWCSVSGGRSRFFNRRNLPCRW
jgi:hypothetical protein